MNKTFLIFPKLLKYGFLVIGLGMMVGSYFSFRHTQSFVTQSHSAKGVVIELKEQQSRNSDGYLTSSYYPVVEFKTEKGETIRFQSRIGSNPPDYYPQEEVDLLYLPENPQNAEINSFFALWFFTLFLAGMGVVFALIGGGGIYYGIRRKKDMEWLRQFGKRLPTQFQYVESTATRRTRYQNEVREQLMYQVVSQGQEQGKVYVFKSDFLPFNPEPMLAKNQVIEVLVDPQNMKKYWMDLSFLPEYQG